MSVEFQTVDLKMDGPAVEAQPQSPAPPVYELHPSSTAPTYSNESPPSYESLFGRVRQMRDESSGNTEFAKKLVGCVMCGTVCSIISICVMIAIPMACMVFGGIYIGECPKEPYIPIYLIVYGVFGFIKAIVNIMQHVVKKRQAGDEEEEDVDTEANKTIRILSFVDGPISCFIICWFICGSVWTYRIHDEYTNILADPDYCNPTLYMFAFWILTVQYITLALVFLCCCVGLVVVCCVAGKQRS